MCTSSSSFSSLLLLPGLVTDRPTTFEECIHWARLEFEKLFGSSIKQLLHNFPLDMTTTTGAPFWSGHKRAPDAVAFDIDDPAHLDFVVSAANLRAQIYGLQGTVRGEGVEVFLATVPGVDVPAFVPKEGVKIAASEKEMKEEKEKAESGGGGGGADMGNIDEMAAAIAGELPAPASLGAFRMVPLEFEKDDDSNFHIDFIVAGR